MFWSPHAEDRLEELLRDASNQTECATAARAIDQRLASQPLDFGESRYDAVRIAFVYPLGIQYELHQDADAVIVYEVWRIDVKRGS